MAEKPEKKPQENRLFTAIKIIGLLLVLSLCLSFILGLFAGDFDTGNTALIKVDGPIVTTGSGFFGSDYAVSEDIVKLINKADKNPEIEAIIIEVNSPGGSAVASDEIGTALKKTNKTTVAVVRDVGASGGYWVASATDHIIANKMSITGSIGVISSYLDFSGFISRYNISYERLVAGEYKDIGTPLRELAPEERKMIQEYLEEIHAEFIQEVAANRNMPVGDVEKLATGMFYTGKQAEKLGLVDELGGMEEAKEYISKKLNMTVETVEYERQVRLSDIFAGLLSKQSFTVGEGIGHSLISSAEGKGVLS